MAAQAISVDRGASGLLRHRFVRAVAASMLVLVTTTLLLITVYAAFTYSEPEQQAAGGWTLPLGIVLLLAVALAIAAAISFVFDVLHRRLLAFAWFLALLAVTVLLGVAGSYSFLQLVGLFEPTTNGYALWQNWSATAICFLGALIAAEGVGWAFWQMTIDRADYFAARGWRPPPWRLFSTLRARMGLPAFISNFGRGRLVLTGIYFLHAVLNLGLVAMLLMPYIIFNIPQDGSNTVRPLVTASAILALLLLNFAGLGRVLQGMAAKRATKLYQDAREWDARAPIVFLRAFDQDAAKLPARSRDPLVKFPAGCGEARTIDEILLEHASAYGPVIAIGDPRNPTPPLGAARVFVPGEGTGWQHVVTSLLAASNAVVMSPGAGQGVQWEIDLLAGAQGRLRVILLANPELTAEQNLALFARLMSDHELPKLGARQAPIAAFQDKGGWRVLTASTLPCVQTYTVALNMALQTMLGMRGTPLKRRGRRRKETADA